MKELFFEIRSALLSTLIFAVVLCGLYPIAVWVIAQTVFPRQANGSLIVDKEGAVRGSSLIGQGFSSEKYFHPRPSAAGNGYDGANSGGSNLGPNSKKLKDQIQDRIALYRLENGLAEKTSVPADAVTASGSGLDPHISIENARLQINRVAKARNRSAEQIQHLIDQNIDSNHFGIFGEPGVNVLKLNLALDNL